MDRGQGFAVATDVERRLKNRGRVRKQEKQGKSNNRGRDLGTSRLPQNSIHATRLSVSTDVPSRSESFKEISICFGQKICELFE